MRLSFITLSTKVFHLFFPTDFQLSYRRNGRHFLLRHKTYLYSVRRRVGGGTSQVHQGAMQSAICVRGEERGKMMPLLVPNAGLATRLELLAMCMNCVLEHFKEENA